MSVSISHACNLNCYYCYFDGQHKDTPEMKKAYFNILYKIKGHQLDTIMMNNGGEVFVYYDEIIEYLKSLTPKDTRQVTFVTNLVLLNEKRFKEFKQISENTGVTYFFLSSVDGIKKESYEAICLGGKFEKITENLHLLADIFGPQQAVILYTIKKPNINETKNVEKYFMDTFGIRCSISFDVYDKECEEKYNSILRKDYTKEEKEVSKKEDNSFKLLEKETVEKWLLTVVTWKVPSEKALKQLSNKFYIFLLCKRAPKYINNYNNIVFIKTSKRNFYKNLIIKLYTKFFIYVKDISSLVINDITILNYFLNKTDKQVLKIINSYNSKVTMSSIKCGSLILNTNFFKKHFYNIENSKNIQNNFIKKTNHPIYSITNLNYGRYRIKSRKRR